MLKLLHFSDMVTIIILWIKHTTPNVSHAQITFVAFCLGVIIHPERKGKNKSQYANIKCLVKFSNVYSIRCICLADHHIHITQNANCTEGLILSCYFATSILFIASIWYQGFATAVIKLIHFSLLYVKINQRNVSAMGRGLKIFDINILAFQSEHQVGGVLAIHQQPCAIVMVGDVLLADRILTINNHHVWLTVTQTCKACSKQSLTMSYNVLFWEKALRPLGPDPRRTLSFHWYFRCK